MARMSDGDIYVTVFNAGFGGGPSTITAVAIALAESGGDSTATHKNTNGSTDYGLFQINSIHSDLLRKYNWRDPKQNAKMAFIISSGGKNYRPWTTYNTGAYRRFVGRATRAAGGSGTYSGSGTGSLPGTGDGATTAPDSGNGDTGTQSVSLSSGTKSFVSTITDGNTWLRVAMFLIGIALAVIGIIAVSGKSALQVKRAIL